MYIIPHYSQSKLYQTVLDDLATSSLEIKRLKKQARKSRLAKFKLNRIINDVLKIRLSLGESEHQSFLDKYSS